jgi:hypothetical protein
MKKANKIHNLDQLEREIYRLKLEARNIEKQLDRNLDHLQDNYFSMAMNSIFGRKKREADDKPGFFESLFRSDGFNAAMSKMTETVVAKAAAGIETLIDKLFNKNK